MTKTALLIGAPGGVTSRYLHGVQHDLKNFKRFLQSPQGGAWLDDEILEFPDPTIEQLNNIFDTLHASYTIVYISGDGSTDQFGRRLAHLSNGDTFADTDFLSLQSKGLLIIMDTNRKAGNNPKYLPMWHKYTNTQLEFARKKYNQWITDCKGGQVIIHAASHTHEAGDSALGGIFTNALLFFGNGLKPGKLQCTFASIKRIGDITINIVRRHESPQQPYMAYINGNPRLPFAMGVPDKVPAKKRVKTKSNAGGSLLLSVLLAGLFLLDDDEPSEE